MILSQREKDTANVSHVSASVPVTQHDSFHDTGTVCIRNSIADVTFLDKDNFIKELSIPAADKTLLYLSENTRSRITEEKQVLVRHLRDGEVLPSIPVRDDWFLFVLIAAGLLLAIVRSASRSSHPAMRYFLFRGINDPDSRDTGGMFYWQNTLFNLLAFLILSMFSYRVAAHYGFIPPGTGHGGFWLISVAAILIALTFRHVVCIATGSLSEQREAFNEYLVTVYQFYQYSAILLLVPVVMISYTAVIPSKVLLVAGFAILGVMYLFRVARLLIIFINRNISIFYLILYLCALEILPVAVVIRYFSDRV